jgi:hypothetical protein
MSDNVDVFINCPYQDQYESMLRAIVFAILAMGFNPRPALENWNSGSPRVTRICELISACRFAVHDISYAGLQPETQLPHLNMAFELGLWIGALNFGSSTGRETLIVQEHPNQLHVMISDSGGLDPLTHGGEPLRTIGLIRSWLYRHARVLHAECRMPSAPAIQDEFTKFQEKCDGIRLLAASPSLRDNFAEFHATVCEWIEQRRASPLGSGPAHGERA